MPSKRVQVTGDLWHGKVPDGAVYVGRGAPGLPASPFANPFRPGRPRRPGEVTVRDYEHAVALFRRYLNNSPTLIDQVRSQLAGKDLACWCKPGRVCHADVLLEYANPGQPDQPAPALADEPYGPLPLHKRLHPADLSQSTRLICETVAARMRLGEAFWTFDASYRSWLRKAEAEGAIFFEAGVAEKTYRVRLTDPAQRLFLSADHMPPIERLIENYSRALDEIHTMWGAAAVESINVKALMGYRSLPAGVRARLEMVEIRLREAAAGRGARAYSYLPEKARQEMLAHVGGLALLTRGLWEEVHCGQPADR